MRISFDGWWYRILAGRDGTVDTRQMYYLIWADLCLRDEEDDDERNWLDDVEDVEDHGDLVVLAAEVSRR